MARVKTKGGQPKDLIVAMKSAVGSALGECILIWWRQIMPGHFEISAHSKYGYQQRSEKYIRQKVRRFGGGARADLVYRGESREAAKRGIWIKPPRGKAKTLVQAVGVMKVPPHFYKYRKGYGQPDKANELTRTTITEQNWLNEELKRRASAALEAERRRMPDYEEVLAA